jgi:phenylacetate-CoA oxygenase PaaH subunit
MIFEVFRQERRGQAFQHAGSLAAPDLPAAELYAKEFYGRRNESEALWVVPRDAIHEIHEFVDELKRNYHRVDGYSLKEKLKEARDRAGTTPARDRSTAEGATRLRDALSADDS